MEKGVLQLASKLLDVTVEEFKAGLYLGVPKIEWLGLNDISTVFIAMQKENWLTIARVLKILKECL